MKKILTLLDNNILRFSIALAILFIPLYPKVPSIGISHVWVYIRLEDFLILLVSLIWLVQLVRKKVALPKPEGYWIAIYWIAGLVSLLYCLLFIAAHLQNFFPQIAVLEYIRRIEYMILFFAAFSAVKNKKDIVFFLTTEAIALIGVTLYGFGQRFYPFLYTFFPTFFKQHPFCFPAFLTGNEEFAKGTPLCLDPLSRLTSTFGGQYDLAAYLVLTIPLFIALFIVIKKWYWRVGIALLVFLALELLNFTSSRTSFGAYIIGIVSMLIFWKKKWWLIPVLFVSIGSLFVMSNATLARYEKTIQPVQVVQIENGTNLQLQKIISKTQQKVSNKTPQSPPPGTVTVGTGADLGSGSAQVLTEADLQALQQQNINISTVSGAFLLKKAYALDISFTTRFQAEWPRDWAAFLSSPIFGTGYSSLTLASDNDYLRALGETGLVGAISFLMIFAIFGIYMKKVIPSVKDPYSSALVFGLAGGVIGLLVNAALIDVFEASKVAEPLWMLLGIGLGGAKLYQKQVFSYKKELSVLFTSSPVIIVYLFILTLVGFVASINNYFVADDYVWLHWAATAVPSDLSKYFINAHDFFYRPLDKVLMYVLYNIFSFNPQGYHLFNLFLHFLTATGVYFLAKKLTKNKLLGFLTAVLFVFHPAHSENVYWISTLSDDLSSLFIVYMMLAFMRFRQQKAVVSYILAIIFGALAFTSYEIAVIVPFVLLALDIFILKPKRNTKTYFSYLPFILLFILYFVIRAISHAFSGGGDYSYHLSRIVPNVVGNFFGYTGIFLAGLPFMSFYNFLRTSMRSEWIYFSVVLVLIIGFLVWVVIKYKKRIIKLWYKKNTQLFVFCLVFAFIALLPFMPLGNIAPRYLYLASAGFCLALVLVLQIVITKVIKTPRYAEATLIIVAIVFASIYFVSNINEQQNWQQSGLITKNTLLYFRKNYSTFTASTDIYFINKPVMYNGTWVFPVGLPDSLWFIYLNNLPHIHEVGSIKEAKGAISASKNKDSYIFLFNKQGNIREVQ